MPAFEILHICNTTPEIRVAATVMALSRQEALHRTGHDYPAPPGWTSNVRETEFSRLLAEWGACDCEPGYEEPWDALMIAAGEELAEPAACRLTLLALADLADEQGIYPDLADCTRATCGLTAKAEQDAADLARVRARQAAKRAAKP